MTASLSKRAVLKGAGALGISSIGLSAFAVRAVAAPAAEAVTPALIDAAKKEGKLTFYTAMDLQFAERLGKSFEAKYPGIAVRVERSGAERVFTRIGQEYGSNIHTVDFVNTADQAHCIVWKRNGWLAPYLPEEVVKNYDARFYDPDGLHVTTRILISPIAYNTDLVKKDDAPKSFKDLLDPKWKGKLVKAHPAYSGTIMNSTFQMQRDLGWGYLEKLAAQNVMQVQSATDTPKRIALGERAVMVDGAGYLVIRDKEAGRPVDMTTPVLQTRLSAEQLGKAFATLRQQNLDLSPALVLTPEFTEAPKLTSAGALMLKGNFPSRPLRINFAIDYLPIDGYWMIDQLSVSAARADEPAVAAAPAPVAEPAPAAPAPVARNASPATFGNIDGVQATPPAGRFVPVNYNIDYKQEFVPTNRQASAQPRAIPARPAAAPGRKGPAAYLQVTSQRSEAEAKAAFNSLRGRFPAILGDQQPIIRRADLGDKGIYYRAQIGPVDPAEAERQCNELKAVGGQCFIQYN